MQMRLAFSVAAHLEPEILLVDEVLAVGDAQFQKKCLGKMKEVSAGGRTVVLISHQLNQIRKLCDRAIWLDAGQMRREGPTAEVLTAYESAMLETAAVFPARSGERARFQSWRVVGQEAPSGFEIDSLKQSIIDFELIAFSAVRDVNLGIALYTADGEVVWAWEARDLSFATGKHRLIFEFPMLPLRPGVYTWMIGLWDLESCLDCWYSNPAMVVALPNYQHSQDQWNGLLNVPCKFDVRAA